MRIERVESLPALDGLKQRYLEHTSAPLDGMWLHGFVPMAAHFALYDADQLAGYLCVNDEGYLLQFHVEAAWAARASALFEAFVIHAPALVGPIAGAFVSTAEPRMLSLCLDHYVHFEVHALMYEFGPSTTTEPLALEPLRAAQLPVAVRFAVDAIASPEAWVTGYYAQLIERGELHGVWKEGALIATGENRAREDLSTPHADLGVVVAPAHRGRGLATQILATLAADNERGGVHSICSTERDNLAAQGAITRAGFVARNRIIRFDA